MAGWPRRCWSPRRCALPLPEGRSFDEGSALILTYATTIHALLDRGKLKAGRDPAGARRGRRRRPGGGRARQGLWRARRRRGLVGGEGRGGAGGGRGRDDRLSARAVRQGRGEGARPAVQGGGRARRRRRDLRSGRRRLYRGGVARDRLGGAAAWWSASRPASRGCRSTSPCSRAATCCGVFWGAFAGRDPAANAAHVQTLFRLWEEGKIAPRVSRTWPLAEGGEAIAHMAARQAVGKLVVTMGG